MSLKPVLSQNKNTNEEFGVGKKMVVKFLPKTVSLWTNEFNFYQNIN